MSRECPERQNDSGHSAQQIPTNCTHLFFQFASIHDGNLFGVLNGRQTMCNRQTRSAYSGLFQCCLHYFLTLVVQGGCRFVEKKNLRRSHQCTSDGNYKAMDRRALPTLVTHFVVFVHPKVDFLSLHRRCHSPETKLETCNHWIW